MSKIRVYELAKALNMDNKKLVEKLREQGIEVKSHMSSVDNDVAERFKSALLKKNSAPKTEKKPAEQNNAGGEKKPEQKKPDQRQRKPMPEKRTDERNNKRFNNKTGGNGNNRPAESRSADGSGSDRRRNNDRLRGFKPQDNRGGTNAKRDVRQDEKPSRFNDRRNNNNKNNAGNNAGNNDRGFNDGRKDNRKDSRKDNRKDGRKENRSYAPAPSSFAQPKKNNKKIKKNKKKQAEQEAVIEEISSDDILEIKIEGDTIAIKDLAAKCRKTAAEIISVLFKKHGMFPTANDSIDFETAEKVCEDFDIICEKAEPEPEEEVDILAEAFKDEDDDESSLVERPPVVVVMGHVDHGKTSLLDAIRHSKVTAGEAGGITQHIGAYTVAIDGKPITFLDTPGHEAFTAMRMRGAQVTDIAILVVAADDGVMPQTIEAINHAKAAEVEIIVAINKIDKPGANPDRVKQELVEYGLVAEDWGGETICVPVSAATKEGLDQLLEMIILVSEMKELKANPNKRARGNIIEAQLDKGRGAIATVLVQNGTLKVGDPVVAGTAYGRVRAMMNDKGAKVKKAGPSMPVEILGLSEVPNAGDMFYVAKNEKQARQVAEQVMAKSREELIKDTPQKVSLDDLFSQIQLGNIKDLNIVIKADVQGSVEAVKQSLEKLSNSEVRIRTIHGGVGAITESDVMLASASNAIIIGFNVRPENSAKSVADAQKVDIRLYRVIYNAIEDITAAMKGMLDPVYEERITGHAQIRQTFKASGVGTIGGSYVTDGKITRNSQVRLLRDNIVIYEGEITGLQRFKDAVKEVTSGYECGILFNKFNDIKEGDIAEAFVMEEIKQ